MSCISASVAKGYPIHCDVFPFTFMCSHMQFLNSGQKHHEKVRFIYILNLELFIFSESLRESIHLLAKEVKYKGNTSEIYHYDTDLGVLFNVPFT